MVARLPLEASSKRRQRIFLESTMTKEDEGTNAGPKINITFRKNRALLVVTSQASFVLQFFCVAYKARMCYTK